MSNKGFRNYILSVLTCGLSSSEYWHICEEPVILSCGHFACKKCLQQYSNYKTVKCLTCNEMNDRDLNQGAKPIMYDFILDTNLNELFNIIYDNFKCALKTCKDIVNINERIDTCLQFVKDEIELKIECIKAELDQLNESFYKELDEIKNDMKRKCETIDFIKFNEETFERDLKQLEENIKSQEDLTRSSLYYYQNKINRLHQSIKEYNENSPKLEFIDSDVVINKDLVGKLIYQINGDVDKKIINRLRENKYDTISISYNPSDLCVLPNGNLLAGDLKYGLVLYDNDLKFTKLVNKINNRSLQISGIATNGSKSIFICDQNNHLIIKTDLELLTEIAVFGSTAGSSPSQLNNPSGICFYNGNVYVCDYSNSRIQKLNSNLELQSTFLIQYQPSNIKNIDHIAILRSSYHCIYFYDLNNFSLLKTYSGHNGVIGVTYTHFYEYYLQNKTWFCYNKSGDLDQKIETKDLKKLSENGSIFLFKSRLCITDNHSLLII